MKYTSGFDPAMLADHFQRHGPLLNITTSATDYEIKADEMFETPKPPNFLECVRPDGDVIRFDIKTEAYAVRDSSNIIRTYYLPVPCHRLPVAQRKPKRCHHELSNLAYFNRNCSRRFS